MRKKKPEIVLAPAEKQRIQAALAEIYEVLDAKIWPALFVSDEETSKKLRKIFADGRSAEGLKLLYKLHEAAVFSDQPDVEKVVDKRKKVC